MNLAWPLIPNIYYVIYHVQSEIRGNSESWLKCWTYSVDWQKNMFFMGISFYSSFVNSKGYPTKRNEKIEDICIKFEFLYKSAIVWNDSSFWLILSCTWAHATQMLVQAKWFLNHVSVINWDENLGAEK